MKTILLSLALLITAVAVQASVVDGNYDGAWPSDSECEIKISTKNGATHLKVDTEDGKLNGKLSSRNIDRVIINHLENRIHEISHVQIVDKGNVATIKGLRVVIFHFDSDEHLSGLTIKRKYRNIWGTFKTEILSCYLD